MKHRLSWWREWVSDVLLDNPMACWIRGVLQSIGRVFGRCHSRWELERWFRAPMPCPSCGEKMEKRKGLIKDLQPDMIYATFSDLAMFGIAAMRMTRVKAWVCPSCNNLKTIKILRDKNYY